MSVEVLLSRLEKVRVRGEGSWMACCPAHEDSDPSLAITQADNGNVLIRCFAGCAPADIMSSVELDMGALFSDDFVTRHNNLIHYEQQRRRIKRNQATPPMDQGTKDKLIIDEGRRKRANGEKLTERDMDLELQAYMRIKGRAS